MELDIEFAEDVAEGEEIDDEYQRPQDRSLGHTGSDWGGT